MRKYFAISAIILTACADTGPVAVIYKPGTTAEQRSNVLTGCETQALSNVPRAMASAVTPTYTTPSNVQCYGSGNYVNCHQYGGQTYGGNLYSYDANQELRDRVTMQCLQTKGYQVISLPQCNAEQSKRAVSSAGRPQPKAENIECVVEGGYTLVK